MKAVKGRYIERDAPSINKTNMWCSLTTFAKGRSRRKTASSVFSSSQCCTLRSQGHISVGTSTRIPAPAQSITRKRGLVATAAATPLSVTQQNTTDSSLRSTHSCARRRIPLSVTRRHRSSRTFLSLLSKANEEGGVEREMKRWMSFK